MKILKLIFMVVFLLVAGTASATIVNITEGNIDHYGFTTGSGGTFGIVDTNSAVGTVSDLSLKLVWPVHADDSGIRITTDLGNPIISSISGFSYWVNAPTAKNPHFAMYLDTNADGDWDTLVRDKRYNTYFGDAWLELDSSGTMSFYTKKTGFPSVTWDGTWADFQTAYGTAVVKQIQISHAGYSVGYPATAYLDDFSFGDTHYVFSYVPEPATIALLGLGGLVLMRKKY